ncbi:MAG: hypothetical protein ACYCT2_08405 [Thermoplasmataceae archaeon]
MESVGEIGRITGFTPFPVADSVQANFEPRDGTDPTRRAFQR